MKKEWKENNFSLCDSMLSKALSVYCLKLSAMKIIFWLSTRISSHTPMVLFRRLTIVTSLMANHTSFPSHMSLENEIIDINWNKIDNKHPECQNWCRTLAIHPRWSYPSALEPARSPETAHPNMSHQSVTNNRTANIWKVYMPNAAPHTSHVCSSICTIPLWGWWHYYSQC